MKAFRLALPFAWVATTLFAFAGHWFPLLVVVASAAVGWVLTPRLGHVSWGIFPIGLVPGALFSLPFVPESGYVVIAGAVVGMFAMVPLSLVAVAGQWITPRPHSLLDGVRLRRTWITAALVSLVSVVIWKPWTTGMGTPMLAASALIVAGCVIADVVAFVSLGKSDRDLGIGDPVYAVAAKGGPYRQEPQVVAVVHGDLPATKRIFYRQLAFDVAAIAVTLLGISGRLTT